MEITITNLLQIQKNAEDVANEIAKSGKLVARAALIIERQAKINATGRPGPKVQTGRLRASITPQIMNPALARVGTNVFYAPYVEFGHKQKPGQFVPPLKKRLVKNFSPAYPFLGPTIEQCSEDLGDMIATFGRDLEQEWQK